LKFNPPGPSGFREFDPIGTANLFEKGISTPKFTNPSLWFFKGPLKWLIKKLVAIYSVIDRKVSENRISAFFNLIHEVVLLKNKINQQKEKLDLFYSDFSEMMTKLKTGLNPEYFVSDSLYDRDYERYKTGLIVKQLSSRDKVLVLYPGWGWILSALQENKIRFHSVTDSEFKYKFIKKEITSGIELQRSILDFTDYKKYNKIILYRNMAYLSGWLLDSMIHKIFKYASPATEIIMIYNNFPESSSFPFESAGITRINEKKLPLYLKEAGFKNARIAGNDSEFLVIFRKP